MKAITFTCGGNSAFEAGQAVVISVMKQACEQATMPEAMAMVRGMFSGAMAVMQTADGNDEVERYFRILLDSDKAMQAAETAARKGVH